MRPLSRAAHGQVEQRLVVASGPQGLAEAVVTEHARHLRENVEMFLVGFFRYEEHEQQIDRLLVRRLKRYRFGEAQ